MYLIPHVENYTLCHHNNPLPKWLKLASLVEKRSIIHQKFKTLSVFKMNKPSNSLLS